MSEHVPSRLEVLCSFQTVIVLYSFAVCVHGNVFYRKFDFFYGNWSNRNNCKLLYFISSRNAFICLLPFTAFLDDTLKFFHFYWHIEWSTTTLKETHSIRQKCLTFNLSEKVSTKSPASQTSHSNSNPEKN